VAVERLGLELREKVNSAYVRVDAVIEREIYYAVIASDRYRRLCAVYRERHKALALAACQD